MHATWLQHFIHSATPSHYYYSVLLSTWDWAKYSVGTQDY